MGRASWTIVFLSVFLAACAAPGLSPAGSPTPASAAPPTEYIISAATLKNIQPLQTLVEHTHYVTDVVFSPDGAFLASASGDGNISLWDTTSWQEVHTFHISNSSLSVLAFSPDGQLLASAEAIWDVKSGAVVQQLPRPGETGHVAFSPDGSMLAIGGFPATVSLVDVATGESVREFEKQPDTFGFFNVVFSPDGSLLAAGGNNGTATIWDVSSGKITGTFKHSDQSDVHEVAFSPDGRLLAGGGTGSSVDILDVSSGEIAQRVWLNNGIYGLAFSPDGKILALASCNRVAQLVDVETGDTLRRLPHADELMAVAFSPDGTLLAAGGYDNTVVVWGIPR